MDTKQPVITYCLKVETEQTKILDEVVSFLENKKELLKGLNLSFEFKRSGNFISILTEKAYLLQSIIIDGCGLINHGHAIEFYDITYTIFENKELYDSSCSEIKNPDGYENIM
jgi:hypothetical protein